MKKLIASIAIALSFASTAFAGTGDFIVHRGWTQDGEHVVKAAIGADIVTATEAELTAAGVDIWNPIEVAAFFDVPVPSLGGCGINASAKDPDAGGMCNADDGIVGTVGTDKSGASW